MHAQLIIGDSVVSQSVKFKYSIILWKFYFLINF